MKTIFIPLYQGYTARNFFYTDVFQVLKERKDLRLVIFAPPLKAGYYQERFASDNVIIEELEPIKETSFKKFFSNLCYYSLPTRSGYIQIRRFYLEEKRLDKLILRLFINKVVARFKWYRDFLRWFDEKFLTLNYFALYFEKYHPALVYLPHFISPLDMELSQEAKKRGIFRVGLVNSWDNVSSRGLCLGLPDKIIAHNNFVKEHLQKYHDFKEADIYVSGVPQFDLYFKGEFTKREKFLQQSRIPQNKRFIIFCPLGERFSKTEWQVVKIIEEAIKQGKLPQDLHILVRNNPVIDIYLGDLQESEKVTIEYPGKKFSGGKMNDWEFEPVDTQHLADSIYHCALYVGCASTMVIDSVAFNKPLVGVNFDGWERLGFYEGVNWTFTTTHFQTIIKTGALTLAASADELIKKINDYLNNPKMKSAERQKMLIEHYYKIDGLSGKRVGEYILKCLNLYD